VLGERLSFPSLLENFYRLRERDVMFTPNRSDCV